MEPVAHTPDPNVFWTLPRHLAGYRVSGWTKPDLDPEGIPAPGMTMNERLGAAMMRAQYAEDEWAITMAKRDTEQARAEAATAGQEAAQQRAQLAVARVTTMTAERDLATSQLQATMARADSLHAEAARLGSRLEQLTEAMIRRDEAEAAALQRDLARDQLVKWAANKRVLAGLLRRTPGERLALIRSQAAGEPAQERFAQRLGQTRMLIGLLRRPTHVGEAVLREQRSAATAEPPIQIASAPAPTAAVADTPMAPSVQAASFLSHWPRDTRDTLRLMATPARLRRYFRKLGFTLEQARLWANLLENRPTSPVSQDVLQFVEASLRDNLHLRSLAAQIRQSGLFDATQYSNAMGFNLADVDPALHYLLLGEPHGVRPSQHFDPDYYANCYPDVAASGMSYLLHYLMDGRTEGRPAAAPDVRHSNPAGADPSRENVIMVVHETSRTGAPILGWNIALHLAETYNVYTILLGDGPLTPEFQALSTESYGPFVTPRNTPMDIECGLRSLFAGRHFRYAVVNSIESRRVLRIMAQNCVPTLLLMHEFGSYVTPRETLTAAFDWATEIVFPAPIVARSSIDVYPALLDRDVRIAPQGMSVVPASNTAQQAAPVAKIDDLREIRAAGGFIVIGGGSVTYRKGVDLFIGIAAAVHRLGLDRLVQFVWVGGGYQPEKDMGYSVYLKEQIDRSGLGDSFMFIDEVSDLEPVYALADAFLLSSRLDPMPNVSIDAAHRGIPVISFADASGTADLLLGDPRTAIGVVPHLDIGAAAALICRLAGDESMRQQMSDATRNAAESIFNMKRYVAQLDGLGIAAGPRAQQMRNDAETLISDTSFDQELFLGPVWASISREQAIAQYLAASNMQRQNQMQTPVRRPCAGFIAPLWAPHTIEAGETPDPLASFIRQGKPSGPYDARAIRRHATGPATRTFDPCRAGRRIAGASARQRLALRPADDHRRRGQSATIAKRARRISGGHRHRLDATTFRCGWVAGSTGSAARPVDRHLILRASRPSARRRPGGGAHGPMGKPGGRKPSHGQSHCACVPRTARPGPGLSLRALCLPLGHIAAASRADGGAIWPGRDTGRCVRRTGSRHVLAASPAL